MKRWMTFLHRDKRAATSRTHSPAAAQGSFHRGFASLRLDNLRGKKNGAIGWCRPQKLDRVIGRDGARRLFFAACVHQMPGRGPVAVAIKQRTDDSAVQNAGKRFVFLLRGPFSYHFIAANEAANMKSLRVRRAATETGVSRRVKFLERLRFAVGHDHFAPLPATEPGYGRNSGPV